jgi:hypothetical protein
MLLRVRVSSFLAGFGLASAAAFFQLHNDISTSSTFLAAQARRRTREGPRRGGAPAAGAHARACSACALCHPLPRPQRPRARGQPGARPPPPPPACSPPQAQEARDSLERRVAALEALVLKPEPAAGGAGAPAAAAAPAASAQPAPLPTIEEMAEVFAAAAAADE